jgi:uncharacterized protein YjbI with pentapeptide repeats
MANAAQLAILDQGVDAWNEWRDTHPGPNPDLRGADLSGRALLRIHFRDVDLREAILRKADLRGAGLSGAKLDKADLRSSDLRGANLRGASLAGADLRGADLTETRLCEANLLGTNFSEATVGQTEFGDLDLSLALGVETVKHWAGSTLGIDTLFRSKGNIPDTFLRGVGVPESFVALLHSGTLTL